MIDQEEQSAPYEFANIIIDPGARELFCAGKTVKVEPKVFDLLLYLARNRNRVVDKNELQEEIWKGTIVTEASLTRCVMKARQAVGDRAKPHRVIRTVHGCGYRFVARLAGKNTQGSEATDTNLPLPDKPSIAVLPFTNLSNDPDQDYFCDGITDDIITELSRFRSLFVIARHSSFSFKGQNLIAQEVGLKLGVAYILDGSMQKSGNRLRINSRLVDAATGKQIWADRYDREIEDVFLLQVELAKTIAATIGGRVEASRGRQRANKQNLEAYDLVLKAQALYYRTEPEAVRQAKVLLQQAIDIDPGNARGLILLAACHSIESWSFWSKVPARSLQQSLEFARRSIALDDTDSLAHALFGEILFDSGQEEAAEAHFLKAISLNPNDIAGRTLYASLLAATGRANEGLTQIEIAERLDPFGLSWIPWVKGTVLFSAGRYDECIAVYKRLDALPNEANLWLAAAHVTLGETDMAQQILRRFLDRAAMEMPTFPGRKFDQWQPKLHRYLGYKHRDDHQFIVSQLESIWR